MNGIGKEGYRSGQDGQDDLDPHQYQIDPNGIKPYSFTLVHKSGVRHEAQGVRRKVLGARHQQQGFRRKGT